MMNSPESHDVFLNVRRAYRLLYDYQQCVLDAVRYIGAQLDVEFHYAHPLFYDGLKKSAKCLEQSSWAWLSMVWTEFEFKKELGNDQRFSVSCIVIADTGWGEVDNADQAKTDTFASATDSASKFAFVFRETNWRPVDFTNEKERMMSFIRNLVLQPAGPVYGGRCYDLSCLTNRMQADDVIDDMIALAKKLSLPLSRVKPARE